MTIEEKVRAYKEIIKKIDELEDLKKSLVAEILQLFPQDVKKLRLTEYRVTRYSRLSIKTPLEIAKTFGAVKLQEVIDREKIKQLYQLGEAVPNVSEIQYINVFPIKNKLCMD